MCPKIKLTKAVQPLHKNSSFFFDSLVNVNKFAEICELSHIQSSRKPHFFMGWEVVGGGAVDLKLLTFVVKRFLKRHVLITIMCINMISNCAKKK